MIVLEDLILRDCLLTGILPFWASLNLSQSDMRVQTELHRHMDHVSIGAQGNVAPQAKLKRRALLETS